MMVVFDCHDDDVRCHMITIMLSINGKIGSCQITWISYDHVDDDGKNGDGEDDDSKIVADGQIASGSKIVIANSKW